MTARFLALLLLGACSTDPLAVRALDRMKDADAAADWAALAAAEVPACAGADPVCAARHALRARGCFRLATNLSETENRHLLDCAVDSGRAALAASGETSLAQQAAWREAYAAALYARRQARPGPEACADNTPLLEQADRLRAEAPGAARPRFLAASARLTAIARACTPALPPCPALATARALLSEPPPEAAPQWRALGTAIEITARRLACPT
jgi:hypothetical protein